MPILRGVFEQLLAPWCLLKMHTFPPPPVFSRRIHPVKKLFRDRKHCIRMHIRHILKRVISDVKTRASCRPYKAPHKNL